MDVAKKVKELLDAIGADSYCKTSGSTGIHIYIPLGAKYDYDQSKQLAELVVTMVNQEMPGITSIERKPAKRKGKIYLDYLQNRETQTATSPFTQPYSTTFNHIQQHSTLFNYIQPSRSLQQPTQLSQHFFKIDPFTQYRFE